MTALSLRQPLRRFACLLVGHSRKLRMQFCFYKGDNRLDFTAHCARCGKALPKRIVSGRLQIKHRTKGAKGRRL